MFEDHESRAREIGFRLEDYYMELWLEWELLERGKRSPREVRRCFTFFVCTIEELCFLRLEIILFLLVLVKNALKH